MAMHLNALDLYYGMDGIFDQYMETVPTKRRDKLG